MKNNIMKTYNYSYDRQPISKDRFLKAVPENWENDVNELGHYSYLHLR